MDLEIVITLIVTIAIAIGGWIFAWYQSRSNSKQKRREEQNALLRRKIDTMIAYLNEFGELVSLYRFYATYKSRLVRDEDGGLMKDDAGNFIISKSIMEPDPRFEGAITSLEGSDISGAIALQIVRIRKKSSEASDLSYEFDPDGNLNRDLGRLYLTTVDSVEPLIEKRDFNGMISVLEEADKKRREIRLRLEGEWQEALK